MPQGPWFTPPGRSGPSRSQGPDSNTLPCSFNLSQERKIPCPHPLPHLPGDLTAFLGQGGVANLVHSPHRQDRLSGAARPINPPGRSGLILTFSQAHREMG